MTGMADVLAEHSQSQRNNRCACGWRGDVSKPVTDPNNIYVQHLEHVAEMLSAAGFGDLREAQAQALQNAADAAEYHLDIVGNPIETEPSSWLRSRAAVLRGQG